MTILGKLRNVLRSEESGYTLVELIVAAAIFITISIVAVGVLVSVLNSSSKTAAQRSVQQDARVNLEEVARTVRASSIDYTFYEKAADEGQADCALPGDASGSKVLALFWTESVPGGEPNRKRVVFFYDGSAIYRSETSDAAPTPSCSQVFNAVGKVRLTGDSVTVTDAKFFVSPLTSPYKDPCASKNSLCQVRRDTHPRVTMLMTVRTLGTATSLATQTKFSQTTVQTTIGTRAYPITGLVGQAAPSAGP